MSPQGLRTFPLLTLAVNYGGLHTQTWIYCDSILIWMNVRTTYLDFTNMKITNHLKAGKYFALHSGNYPDLNCEISCIPLDNLLLGAFLISLSFPWSLRIAHLCLHAKRWAVPEQEVTSPRWIEHSHGGSGIFAGTRRPCAVETALRDFLSEQVSVLICPDFGKGHIKPCFSWQRAKGAFTCS